MHRTWDAGQHPDAHLLIELRARADAYRSIAETPFEEWIDGYDPEA